jgi:DNA-binding winged helix-turn-helix (wHTH) protein
MGMHRLSLLTISRKHLGGIFLLGVASIICVAFSFSGNDDFDAARREILLRRLGHEVLLASGDTNSLVLPIKQINKNEYQVSFEKAFTFQPDSLVRITQRLLAKDPLSRDYVVNVLRCTSSDVMYGFAISQDRKNDIVACLGRKQPVACYVIDVKFEPKGIVSAKTAYLLGALSLLAFVGVMFSRPAKMEPSPPAVESTDVFALGSISFDAANRKLTVNDQSTDLTKTEARVLRMFALSPNEIIERSRLQKEIWEDDGVIVGRSLDMFISKLRKKLEMDPSVKIAVIRGKGYKLEINA